MINRPQIQLSTAGRRFSITRKLVTLYAIAAVICGLLLADQLNRNLSSLRTQQLDTLGNTLSTLAAANSGPMILSQDSVSLNISLKQLSEDPQIRGAEIIGTDGTPLAQAGQPGDLVYDRPILVNQSRLGHLRLYLSPLPLAQLATDNLQRFWLLLLASLGLMVLLAWGFARHLKTPLVELKTAASELQEDTEISPLDEQRVDEFGDIARLLNRRFAAEEELLPEVSPDWSDSDIEVDDEDTFAADYDGEDCRPTADAEDPDYQNPDPEQPYEHPQDTLSSAESDIPRQDDSNEDSQDTPGNQADAGVPGSHSDDIDNSSRFSAEPPSPPWSQSDQASAEEQPGSGAPEHRLQTRQAPPEAEAGYEADLFEEAFRRPVAASVQPAATEPQAAPTTAISATLHSGKERHYLLYINHFDSGSDSLESETREQLVDYYQQIFSKACELYKGELQQDDCGNWFALFAPAGDDNTHGVSALCAAQLFRGLYRGLNQRRIHEFQPVLNLKIVLVCGDTSTQMAPEARRLSLSVETNELITHQPLYAVTELNERLLAGGQYKKVSDDTYLISALCDDFQNLIDRQAKHFLGS